ncbi:MAG: hypothetical protein FWF11_05230, partial [Coriobacteriia bacterium]|nr:hypothetical protein [Coriobacteriia bacterium]
LRYAKHRPLPEKYRPTIMVLTAPMSICIFGYLSAVPTTSTTLLLCMLVLAAGSYLIALCSLPGLMRLPFYPAHSALGFPMVVSAFAFKRASEYLTSQGYVVWTTPVLVTELLAIVVVCYVLARYLRYLYGQLQQTGAAK